MQIKKNIVVATAMLAASAATAEPAPKPVDLSKFYGHFENSDIRP